MPVRLEDALSVAKEGDIIECVVVGKGVVAWRSGSKHGVHKDDEGRLYVQSLVGTRRYDAAPRIKFIVHPQSVSPVKVQAYDGTLSGDRVADIANDILADALDKHAPDSWDELATGGRVKAETKEWQPDTLDVDLSKKISDW